MRLKCNFLLVFFHSLSVCSMTFVCHLVELASFVMHFSWLPHNKLRVHFTRCFCLHRNFSFERCFFYHMTSLFSGCFAESMHIIHLFTFKCSTLPCIVFVHMRKAFFLRIFPVVLLIRPEFV